MVDIRCIWTAVNWRFPFKLSKYGTKNQNASWQHLLGSRSRAPGLVPAHFRVVGLFSMLVSQCYNLYPS